jgi:hypothetical protein
MTQQQALDLVREIRSLERLEASIQQQMMEPGAALEWKYAVVALDDRLRWCKYCASLEDPAVIAAADAVLQAEKQVTNDIQVNTSGHPSERTPERPSIIERIH